VFVALYIIFEDDIKRAALPPSADLPLEIMITVILVFIAMEMGESLTHAEGLLMYDSDWDRLRDEQA
jgi:hypothetical protein